MKHDGDLLIDFTANVNSFPFVTRSIYNHSSFTIHSLNGGYYLIGIFTAEMCDDGILVLTTNNKFVEFSSNQMLNEFFELKPGTKKCLAIMNSTPTTVFVDLNSSSSDKLYSYLSYKKDPIISSGCEKFSISNKKTLLQMLFSIQVADVNAFRNIKFNITSEVQQEKDRYVIYGNNAVENIKKPKEIKIIKYSWELSRKLFISLISLVILFIFLSIAVFIKYHSNFHQFRINNKNPNIEQPMLPSAFVR